MKPNDFIAKWRGGGDERRDAQPFFEDLCRLVGHKTPREADPEHRWFTYEYGASKTNGGNGWADVWKKGFFGWEAKGTHKDLERAYEQLKMYADALENPPLLVVSDLHSIVVHTNFTNTVKRTLTFTIEQLGDFDTFRILDSVFHNPESLRPTTTRAGITKDAAAKFTSLAEGLRDRGNDPHEVAHFLNRLLFAMFAEDIRLLPNNLFTKLVASSQGKPDLFEKRCRELFAAMNSGGDVAFENVPWFNGGLFDDDKVLPLVDSDLKILHEACALDWSSIEPTIFGTLFERGLDPNKRSQTGAHYTDPETIMKIVRPVVVEPWMRAWETEKVELAKALDKAKKSVSEAAQKRYARFLESLRAFRVLDPACGSGNFLYLSLRALKDIEKRVIIEGEALGLMRPFPGVGPRNVKGIEINDYAAELARLTIWIGEIQWMLQNGFGTQRDPILQPLDQVENRDALLNPDGGEASWPPADVIVGNPPFLGGKKHLDKLGDAYTHALRAVYKKRVPGMADLVCYWFEKAGEAVRSGRTQRVGLVATNSIRAGASRKVLIRATDQTRIFDAWKDEDWVNDGAAVRVSLVCFGNSEQGAFLDGGPVAEIFPDLTSSDGKGSGVDLKSAVKLTQNKGCAFVATVKSGAFDIPGSTAREWLKQPNPNGRPNADVVRPWANGLDVTRRPSDTWIVDFGVNMPESEAAMYEAPFAHVVDQVRARRLENQRKSYREKWWRLAEPIPTMRDALADVSRFIATPADGKQRIFAWMSPAVLPDHQLVVIARDDDTMFGLVHSRIHEVWSCRAEISRMGVGNTPRYKPPVHFEKFPFPEGLTPDIPASAYAGDPRAQCIANAACALVEARDRWLNPPEWIERIPEVVAGYPDRIVAKPGHANELKKRTLTKLYNTRPAWLDHLHRDLDEAVAAAYGWTWPLNDDEILQRLLNLNLSRA